MKIVLGNLPKWIIIKSLKRILKYTLAYEKHDYPCIENQPNDLLKLYTNFSWKTKKLKSGCEIEQSSNTIMRYTIYAK